MDSHTATEQAATEQKVVARRVTLEPDDARRLASLCGQFDEHLRQIEQRLDIEIRNRGNDFSLHGPPNSTRAAGRLLTSLYRETDRGVDLTPDEVHLALQQLLQTLIQSSPQPRVEAQMDDQTRAVDSGDAVDGSADSSIDTDSNIEELTLIRTKKCTVKPRGLNQQRYVRAVQTQDINFGVGPAGTGKTYLAVACAVEALLKDEVERILLVRPAVEAGEKLGFLPGDLAQKVDPYLRPLYDALYEMLGFETVDKLIERNVIEVAPLAYMRGRTLNNAFVILDESQNTTREQMKMFLTRIGFGSTAVINGDPSQIDLPRGQASGLRHAMQVLEHVAGISFIFFTAKDVVRHPLVQRIVEAYDQFEQAHDQNQ
ncbi:PhoH family protein [Exilibacterium tricleocarpae]|uniref:PhoH-like protein n=1 Tax=Exilibacterium tricleocarpae TaxID=2591008 RepID=A0A545STF0_9GAMM|nr:PhoH family protein [Exilibacterium tricleocarpae]TQV68231.1 PhoH family protein [Exilibacterium tricleocarpae]